MIAIVDVAGGNLRSVTGAFTALGHPSVVTADPGAIVRATHLVVPGQGRFGAWVQALAAAGLREVLLDALRREVPYLGICLGLQILFGPSEEDTTRLGLGILPGRVVGFGQGGRDPATGARLKVPHMGWNELEGVRRQGPFAPVAEGERVYFVHSYHAVCEAAVDVAAWATHGVRFCAAVGRGRIWATQFHPEKSGRVGLAILDAFARTPA